MIICSGDAGLFSELNQNFASEEKERASLNTPSCASFGNG
jgi:hypothetical protein